MRVLGEIRYEYEPDVGGDDEYQILDEIEKSQEGSDDDMSSEYINSRFEELGVGGHTKVRLIPSISGDGSELGGESIFSHYHYSIKRIEFVREENTVYLHFWLGRLAWVMKRIINNYGNYFIYSPNYNCMIKEDDSIIQSKKVKFEK